MVAELKTNNMGKSPYKMKGYSYPGTSPMKGKPSKKELADAANNPNHPMHVDNVGSDAYLAWTGGSKLAPKKKSTGTYHGVGGKIMNPDRSVNKEKTTKNVAHLNK